MDWWVEENMKQQLNLQIGELIKLLYGVVMEFAEITDGFMDISACNNFFVFLFHSFSLNLEELEKGAFEGNQGMLSTPSIPPILFYWLPKQGNGFPLSFPSPQSKHSASLSNITPEY